MHQTLQPLQHRRLLCVYGGDVRGTGIQIVGVRAEHAAEPHSRGVDGPVVSALPHLVDFEPPDPLGGLAEVAFWMLLESQDPPAGLRRTAHLYPPAWQV